MSIPKHEISKIGERVISLSSLYSSDKEFLEKCEISNKSLLTDLKKGRMKVPGGEYLEQIVRGTGCSGTWLLTGKGSMFLEESKEVIAAEEGGADSTLLNQAFRLLDKIEQQPAVLKALPLEPDIELRLARLLTKVLERRLETDPE